MSIDLGDMDDGTQHGASHLLARGAVDDVRADRRIMSALDDFFLDDDARLDDRLRSGLADMLRAMFDAVEGGLRQHAARLLARPETQSTATMLTDAPMVVHATLDRKGLLDDRELMRELLSRAGEQRLGEQLPGAAPERSDLPSLLVRLAAHPDGIVAAAATATMMADARRRAFGEPDMPIRSDLPAELHHRLVWTVAAVLRDRFGAGEAGGAAVDHALTEAALRSLAAHDEGERLEAAAMRLASAIGATGEELATLLVEAIDDRRLALFTALLAQALGCGYDVMREIVLDPVSDRLWLALRAAAIDRADIARIGLALCDADPRRDVDAFADKLDAIAATAPEPAIAALATARLHHDFRRAVIALAQGRPT